jgi:hypothetical protein
MASFRGGALCVGIAGGGGAADDVDFLGGTRITPSIMRTLDVDCHDDTGCHDAINANASH